MTNLDPRTKLCLLCCLSAPAVFITRPLLLFSVMLITLTACIVIKVDLALIVRKLKGLISFMLFVVIMQCIFTQTGEPLFMIGSFKLFTTDGVTRAILLFLRVVTLLLGASIMTTSPERDSVQALIQLKFPYEIAFMLMIAIRFLPMFAEEFKNALLSIQLRGVNIRGMRLKQRLEVYTYIFMPVVTGVLTKSEDLSMVMEMRGFGCYPKRTSLRTLRLAAADRAVMVIAFVFLLGVIYINFTMYK